MINKLIIILIFCIGLLIFCKFQINCYIRYSISANCDHLLFICIFPNFIHCIFYNYFVSWTQELIFLVSINKGCIIAPCTPILTKPFRSTHEHPIDSHWRSSEQSSNPTYSTKFTSSIATSEICKFIVITTRCRFTQINVKK